MKGVRLMNRTDTKFITSRRNLMELLALASPEYFVQEVDGRRISSYYTVYFDTPTYDMFRAHHCGHANRQKLRIRSYMDSGQSFLEVKTKNNHCRTKKKRTLMPAFDPASPRHDIHFGTGEEQLRECENFVGEFLHYDASVLTQRIENRFHRITLVDKRKTERITIDLDLELSNLITDRQITLDNIVIIELKRNGLLRSPILEMLRQLRIKQMGFSKYCIGTALTYPELPQNRFKSRLRKIIKLEKA